MKSGTVSIEVYFECLYSFSLIMTYIDGRQRKLSPLLMYPGENFIIQFHLNLDD